MCSQPACGVRSEALVCRQIFCILQHPAMAEPQQWWQAKGRPPAKVMQGSRPECAQTCTASDPLSFSHNTTLAASTHPDMVRSCCRQGMNEDRFACEKGPNAARSSSTEHGTRHRPPHTLASPAATHQPKMLRAGCSECVSANKQAEVQRHALAGGVKM